MENIFLTLYKNQAVVPQEVSTQPDEEVLDSILEKEEHTEYEQEYVVLKYVIKWYVQDIP
jgi:hypothetical protein